MAGRAPIYLPVLNTLVLIGFGWLAIVIELAPLGPAGAHASPDLLFAVAAFLVLRRPSATPTLFVLLLGLARDILSGGPTGLGALALLFGVEALRAYRPTLARRSFVSEFLAISAVAALASAFQALALVVTLTPLPALSIVGARILETLVAYLAIAVLFRYVLRIQADPLENTRMIGRAER